MTCQRCVSAIAVPSGEQEGRLNHMLFSRMKTTLIEPDQALRGRSTPVLVNPTFHEIFGIPVQQVPEGSEVASSPSDASGALRSCSGIRRESPTQQRVMRAALPRTRRTKRSAALVPGTPKP